MIYKIVHYKVQEEHLDPVLQAIREFVAGIAANELNTRYEAFQAEDGLSFVHLMAFPGEQEEEYHQQASHTLKFVEILYQRCLEAPAFTSLASLATTGNRRVG